MQCEAVITVGEKRRSISIAEEKYRSIKQAHNLLDTALIIEENFDIVLKNYLKFQKELLSNAANSMIFNNFEERERRDITPKISTLIVNLLNTGRLYIDQTGHQLNGFFNGDDFCIDDFKLACKAIYEESLGYRAAEAICDYTQHRGLPSHAISHRSQHIKAKNGEGILLISFTVLLDLSELQGDSEFSKSILNELNKLGDQIDLRWLMQDYVSSLGDIHNKLRKSLKPVLLESEEFIRATIYEYIDSYNERDKFVFIVASDDNGLTKDGFHLSLGSVERRASLEEKNHKEYALSNGCVIGQHIDIPNVER